MKQIKRELRALRLGIRKLAATRPLSKWVKQALPEQPFDAHLLALSPLYRRSRAIYLREGGGFRATLASSPRTLSSPILLDPLIEYSPIERELVWLATDPIESKTDQLLSLRTYSTSLFHEQSHRILWRMLPPPPSSRDGLRRYLNFVESLVVVIDMALGDELGPRRAEPFYLSGVTYDPGTSVRFGLSRRTYRNYLQTALHATYLSLEGYESQNIVRALGHSGELAFRATQRACNLDSQFIERTNPIWQRRHESLVRSKLRGLKGSPLNLPNDPMDSRIQYLFAERWFEVFGL